MLLRYLPILFGGTSSASGSSTVSTGSFLLLEGGSYLLLEDGVSKLTLE